MSCLDHACEFVTGRGRRPPSVPDRDPLGGAAQNTAWLLSKQASEPRREAEASCDLTSKLLVPHLYQVPLIRRTSSGTMCTSGWAPRVVLVLHVTCSDCPSATAQEPCCLWTEP